MKKIAKQEEVLAVALLVSAWIEIEKESRSCFCQSVALLVSAWIEIEFVFVPCVIADVALLVSAWIEILIRFQIVLSDTSHSS